MKSILRKVVGIVLTEALALGLFSCSNLSGDNGGSSSSGGDPVLPPAKETVAEPTFSVASGEVESGTSVTISCTTEGAKIYYTIDGSAPAVSSTEYTSAISITEAVTIKAIAVK